MSEAKTLCLTCENCYGGCSWSLDFVPVENWTAERRDLKDAWLGKMESYIVQKCPEYIKTETTKGKEILRKIYKQIDKKDEKAVKIYINTKLLKCIVKEINLHDLEKLMQLEIMPDRNIENFRLEY